MAEGRVKWFNAKKGYGFLESAGHGDVFVHYTAIEGEGFRSLQNEDRVTFDIEECEKGLQAMNVRCKAN